MRFSALLCALLLTWSSGGLTAWGQAVQVGKEFQGNWKFTGIEAADNSLDADELDNFGLTVDGDKLTFSIAGQKRSAKITMLSDDDGVKTIDIESLEGNRDGTVFQGIYELEGDTLRMCINLSTSVKQRPTEFDIGEGTTLVILEFARGEN